MGTNVKEVVIAIRQRVPAIAIHPEHEIEERRSGRYDRSANVDVISVDEQIELIFMARIKGQACAMMPCFKGRVGPYVGVRPRTGSRKDLKSAIRQIGDFDVMPGMSRQRGNAHPKDSGGHERREVSRLVIDTTSKVTGKVLTADDQKRLSEESARELAA